MDQLSLPEIFQSKRNRLFLRLRQLIAFERGAYLESSPSPIEYQNFIQELAPENLKIWRDLESRYAFQEFFGCLNLETYKKNLTTLWLLEKFFPQNSLGDLLEAGCQDFARLPALSRFFKGQITGLELDSFPILQGFHSRADKAQYYISLAPGRSSYLSADFFTWRKSAKIILAFYPFVSPHPALAWGLPAEYGRPEPWIEAMYENLAHDGLALVVHQGPWEEEEFDKARQKFSSLELISREVAQCPFAPHPYPPHASLYRKRSL